MCIIVAKLKGQLLPSKTILKNCFDNNSDGAGFMYNDGQAVYIQKGFMSFKSFYKALKKVQDIQNKDVVLHFRISTSGGISEKMCHPFPITTKFDEITKTKTTCKIAMAHNGIISNFGTTSKSDTVEVIQEIFALIPNIQCQKKFLTQFAKNNHSKFAFIDKNNMFLYGDYLLDNGIYYSNSTYKTKAYTYVYNDYWNSDYWNNWRKNYNNAKTKNNDDYYSDFDYYTNLIENDYLDLDDEEWYFEYGIEKPKTYDELYTFIDEFIEIKQNQLATELSNTL